MSGPASGRSPGRSRKGSHAGSYVGSHVGSHSGSHVGSQSTVSSACPRYVLLRHSLAVTLRRTGSVPGASEPCGAVDNDFWMYDNGYLLFQGFVEANARCFWSAALLEAMRELSFEGYVSPGVLLVRAGACALDVVRAAWGRRVLKPPPNYVIADVGDIEDCLVVAVPQSQFTPLPEALCWVILELTSTGQAAVLPAILRALPRAFPAMTQPEAEVVYDALAKLSTDRKVYQTARGYFLVTPETRRRLASMQSPSAATQRRGRRSMLLSTDEALVMVHGDMQTERDGHRTHQCVQTNLADVICGGNPEDKVLYARDRGVEDRVLERRHSLRLSTRLGQALQRAGSLRETVAAVATLPPLRTPPRPPRPPRTVRPAGTHAVGALAQPQPADQDVLGAVSQRRRRRGEAPRRLVQPGRDIAHVGGHADTATRARQCLQRAQLTCRVQVGVPQRAQGVHAAPQPVPGLPSARPPPQRFAGPEREQGGQPREPRRQPRGQPGTHRVVHAPRQPVPQSQPQPVPEPQPLQVRRQAADRAQNVAVQHAAVLRVEPGEPRQRSQQGQRLHLGHEQGLLRVQLVRDPQRVAHHLGHDGDDHRGDATVAADAHQEPLHVAGLAVRPELHHDDGHHQRRQHQDLRAAAQRARALRHHDREQVLGRAHGGDAPRRHPGDQLRPRRAQEQQQRRWRWRRWRRWRRARPGRGHDPHACRLAWRLPRLGPRVLAQQDQQPQPERQAATRDVVVVLNSVVRGVTYLRGLARHQGGEGRGRDEQHPQAVAHGARTGVPAGEPQLQEHPEGGAELHGRADSAAGPARQSVRQPLRPVRALQVAGGAAHPVGREHQLHRHPGRGEHGRQRGQRHGRRQEDQLRRDHPHRLRHGVSGGLQACTMATANQSNCYFVNFRRVRLVARADRNVLIRAIGRS